MDATLARARQLDAMLFEGFGDAAAYASWRIEHDALLESLRSRVDPLCAVVGLKYVREELVTCAAKATDTRVSTCLESVLQVVARLIHDAENVPTAVAVSAEEEGTLVTTTPVDTPDIVAETPPISENNDSVTREKKTHERKNSSSFSPSIRDIVSSFLAPPIVITASCEQSFSLSHVYTHHIEYTRQVTVRQRRAEMAKRERNDMRVARRRCFVQGRYRASCEADRRMRRRRLSMAHDVTRHLHDARARRRLHRDSRYLGPLFFTRLEERVLYHFTRFRIDERPLAHHDPVFAQERRFAL